MGQARERTMTIKTPCQKCGKKKAIKNKITFLPKGKVIIYTRKGCYKCGWHPDEPENEE